MTADPTDGTESLVSIGVPVRNGGRFIRAALEALVGQTHRHLDIVVSDNASSDDTADIVAEFARSDPRIRVFRHEKALTAGENFRFVLDQSRGEYFMWAACDDRRSADHVEGLLEAMRQQPGAVLAFGDVAEIADADNWAGTQPFPYAFESQPGEPLPRRLRRYTRINCLHVYGLLRRDALASYGWPDIDVGADITLLVHLSVAGEFVRAKRGCFYYYVPPVAKTVEARAMENSLRTLKPLPELRLAWACGAAAHRSGDIYGRSISNWQAFAIVYANRRWQRIKPKLFEMSPTLLVEAYRAVFKRRSS